MSRFVKLIRQTKLRKRGWAGPNGFGREVTESQRRAEDELPVLLAESGLSVWRPGDPVHAVGRRVLLGVGAWDRQDLQLLDAIAETVRSGRTGHDRIEVFQFWRECQTPEQLDRYIPGMDLSSIFHSPLVGVWADGILIESASGAQARALLVRTYALSGNPKEDESPLESG